MHDLYNFRYIGKDKIIDLTKDENILLYLLMQKKGDVVTYEEIANALYNCSSDASIMKCINVRISRMNKKLKNELHISNRIGIGYIIY